MATRDEVKDAILRVAGNPVSGPIAALAEAMADAVVELDSADTKTKAAKGTAEQRQKETRVLSGAETR